MKKNDEKVMEKKWALGIFVFVILLFSSTYTINYLVDPFGRNLAFDLKINKEKVLHSDRIAKFEYIEKNPDIDSFIFGSSRGLVYDPALMDKYLGTKAYNFSYTVGALNEHFAFIKYFSKRRKLKEVFISLDLFAFDETFDTKGMLPRKVVDSTGEKKSFLKEYLSLRNLYLSYKTILKNIKVKKSNPKKYNPWENKGMAYYHKYLDCIKEKSCHEKHARTVHATKTFWYAKEISLSRIKMLEELVRLSKEKKFRLSLVLGPITINKVTIPESKYFLQKKLIENIVNTIDIGVWDFSYPSAVTSNHHFFVDFFHYDYKVADMIMSKVYSFGKKEYFDSFGVYITKANLADHLKYLNQIEKSASAITTYPEEIY